MFQYLTANTMEEIYKDLDKTRSILLADGVNKDNLQIRRLIMKTIARTIIEERLANGQKLIGQTSGTYTFRKGSNLARKLEEMGLTENDVDVRTAARAGQAKNDGYQLLIFTK